MSLTKRESRNLADEIREIIYLEVPDPSQQRRAERALRLWLYRLDTMPLHKAPITRFLRVYIKRRARALDRRVGLEVHPDAQGDAHGGDGNDP